MTSMDCPFAMVVQLSHSLHGSADFSFLFLQLSDFARSRAEVVFPTPRGPQNKKAAASEPEIISWVSVCETWGCAMRSVHC